MSTPCAFYEFYAGLHVMAIIQGALTIIVAVQSFDLQKHSFLLLFARPVYAILSRHRAHLIQLDVTSPPLRQIWCALCAPCIRCLTRQNDILLNTINKAVFNDRGYGQSLAPLYGADFGGNSITRGCALRAHPGLYAVAHQGDLQASSRI